MTTTVNEIDRAFLMMNRQDFLPLSSRYVNVFDAPLPIGHGQTCSQPSTVRMMLKWLDVKPGNKVLDIGSGSGWTTALLSVIVGERGSVFAVERIPKLVEFGAENCRRAGVKNARFFYAKESVVGLPEHSPFDNILVSASGKKVPISLKKQLKIGGTLVIPVQNNIKIIHKIDYKTYKTEVHEGFRFVPLK